MYINQFQGSKVHKRQHLYWSNAGTKTALKQHVFESNAGT